MFGKYFLLSIQNALFQDRSSFKSNPSSLHFLMKSRLLDQRHLYFKTQNLFLVQDMRDNNNHPFGSLLLSYFGCLQITFFLFPFLENFFILNFPQNPQLPPLCKVCKLNLSKYTCPGCFVSSCSLPCVKAHKQHTGVYGQEPADPLEEVKRVAESAQRTRVNLFGYSHFKIPSHRQGLRNAAQSHRTKLLFLPSGMSKREKNKSQYNLSPVGLCWRRTSTGMIVIGLLMDPRSPFYELDIRAPIRQQLANLVTLEYPLIHVFLHSHSYDFNVIKDESVTIDHPSSEGISFREKEIEEHGATVQPQKKKSGENLDFDFDVYSDIFAQINSDDFLDWEGDFSKEVKSEERIDCSDLGRVFLQNRLFRSW
ncbi:hypothetical protein AAG906_020817 [Vitis piasezkii]